MEIPFTARKLADRLNINLGALAENLGVSAPWLSNAMAGRVKRIPPEIQKRADDLAGESVTFRDMDSPEDLLLGVLRKLEELEELVKQYLPRGE